MVFCCCKLQGWERGSDWPHSLGSTLLQSNFAQASPVQDKFRNLYKMVHTCVQMHKLFSERFFFTFAKENSHESTYMLIGKTTNNDVLKA